MNKRIFAILLLSLLTIVSFTAILPTRAVGDGDWIQNYKVTDSKTGQTLVERDFQANTFYVYSSILGSTDITVTFTVDVAITGSGNLKLTTAMGRSTTEANRYWELVSSGYALGDSFESNSPSSIAF